MVSNSIVVGDNVKAIGQRVKDDWIEYAYIGKWHLDSSDYWGLGVCPEGWNQNYWYDIKCYLEELT